MPFAWAAGSYARSFTVAPAPTVIFAIVEVVPVLYRSTPQLPARQVVFQLAGTVDALAGMDMTLAWAPTSKPPPFRT